jgi:hypothetical protein
LLDEEVPLDLYEPIRREVSKKLVVSDPVGFIQPVIDGLETNYFEWKAAGVFEPKHQGAAMHQIDHLTNHIQYGFNVDNFYLKVEFKHEIPKETLQEYEVYVNIFEPCPLTCKLNLGTLNNPQKSNEIFYLSGKKWILADKDVAVAFKHFLELGIPFQFFHCSEDDLVKFQIVIYKNGQKMETWPRHGVLHFKVPGSDFEQIEWIV